MSSKNQSLKIIYKNGIPVPIHVIRERRSNSRISLLKDKINIRLPKKLSQKKSQVQILEFLNWAEKKIDKKEVYKAQEIKLDNFNRIYTILDKRFQVKLVKTRMKSFKAVNEGELIYIVIPENFLTPENFSVSLLKRKATTGIMKIFQSEFEKQIHHLHEYALPYIGRGMTSLKFTYTSSKWGSCHSDGQIRLSSRLLFAPEFVRRYVVLHEFAHLKHMNHSRHFWQLVEKICPDYKKAMEYLKKEEERIDF